MAPTGEAEVPVPQKAQLGWFWCLDHFWITFPLAVFWPGHCRAVAGSEEGQDPRGDCCWNLDPAVLGAPLAWGRCCGTVPQVSCPSCPVLAVVSTGVLSQRVLSLLSVSAGCDFHELAPGLTPVCLHHARGAVVASGVVLVLLLVLQSLWVLFHTCCHQAFRRCLCPGLWGGSALPTWSWHWICHRVEEKVKLCPVFTLTPFLHKQGSGG